MALSWLAAPPMRLACVVLGASLLSPTPVLHARDFGGGGMRAGGDFGGAGGGGRGGGGGGGGGYRFSAPRVDSAPRLSGGGGGGGGWADRPVDRSLHQGYQGSHPLYGPAARTGWTGHNITPEQHRQINAGGWNPHGNFDNDRFNRQVNLENNFYNRNGGGWNNNWSNGGYWGSRPWGYGWYNWSPNSWGWWGSGSLGWEVAALATGAVITNLVDQASQQQSQVIEVPDSPYQLNYGSVDAVGSSGADFSYGVSGSPPVKGAVNCQAGLLDGQVPATAAQAQLLNAACQVAYGPDPKGTPLPTQGLGQALSPMAQGALTTLLGLGLGVAGVGLWSRRRGLAAALQRPDPTP